jgi:hypothetical protein
VAAPRFPASLQRRAPLLLLDYLAGRPVSFSMCPMSLGGALRGGSNRWSAHRTWIMLPAQCASRTGDACARPERRTTAVPRRGGRPAVRGVTAIGTTSHGPPLAIGGRNERTKMRNRTMLLLAGLAVALAFGAFVSVSSANRIALSGRQWRATWNPSGTSTTASGR